MKKVNGKVCKTEQARRENVGQFNGAGFSVANRRYMGSKTKLLDLIEQHTGNRCGSEDLKVFVDLFGGTGVVTERFMRYFPQCHINDLLVSNEVIYKAFFDKQDYDKHKLLDFANVLGTIDFTTVADNYASLNYGHKYFKYADAKQIGHIRQLIEDNKVDFNDKEYNILLASLIYSADRSALICGQYGAFRKNGKARKFVFELIKPVDNGGQVLVHRQDANELVKALTADVYFIDPPYNSRDYGYYYHVLEQLIKWDDAPLHGEGARTIQNEKSKYCTQGAVSAFRELIQNIRSKYIVVTYNNSFSTSPTSKNKMSFKEITSILSKKGELEVIELPHKMFDAGKTRGEDKENHKEYLFIVIVSRTAEIYGNADAIYRNGFGNDLTDLCLS